MRKSNQIKKKLCLEKVRNGGGDVGVDEGN